MIWLPRSRSRSCNRAISTAEISLPGVGEAERDKCRPRRNAPTLASSTRAPSKTVISVMPVPSGRVHSCHSHIGFGKTATLEQQRRVKRFRERIGEAISEIQCCRMPAFAIAFEGTNTRLRKIFINGDNFDFGCCEPWLEL